MREGWAGAGASIARLGVEQGVGNFCTVCVSCRPALAGDEILRPLDHHANTLEFGQAQILRAPRLDDAQSTLGADARHPQQLLLRGGIDLHWEKRRVPHGPGTFGIEVRVKIRLILGQQFPCRKMVVPQQPIRLVEPVLPQQGRGGVRRGQTAVRYHWQIGRVKHAPQRIFFV